MSVREPLPPDSAELAERAGSWRSAYVHIPFCRRRCPYCDFAVVAFDEISGDRERSIESYVSAVVDEISLESEWSELDAVNLGGGTPSTLSQRQLFQIIDALGRRFGIATDAEVSLEANPEDVTLPKAQEWAAAGINRVSLGAQSFDRSILGVLGRRHDPEQSPQAVAHLRTAGIRSISVDLLFGSAGENMGSWLETVKGAIDLETDHLSAYGLTVEPGTDLWRQVRGGAEAPDPDHQADEYLALQKALTRTELMQYEVSNWARPGHVCRYNLATWAQGEYIAFGLGAHGHRDGARRRNVRRLDTYLARITAGQRPEAGRDRQSALSADLERVMLGLRRSSGVIAGAVGEMLVESADGRRMRSAGILGLNDGRLVVLKPLLTDTVIRSVLSLSPGDC